MVYTLMLLHVLLGLNVCKADQFGLGYKELTEGKVDVVRIRLRQCSIS